MGKAVLSASYVGVFVVTRRKGDVGGVRVAAVGNAEVRDVRPERRTVERSVVFMVYVESCKIIVR